MPTQLCHLCCRFGWVCRRCWSFGPLRIWCKVYGLEILFLVSSLLWAPHQTAAGWLVVGLLYQSASRRKVVASLFACALLAYYSPMITLGLLPLVLVLLLWQFACSDRYREGVLVALAGVSVLGVLGVYYASVPVGSQPYGLLPFQR